MVASWCKIFLTTENILYHSVTTFSLWKAANWTFYILTRTFLLKTFLQVTFNFKCYRQKLKKKRQPERVLFINIRKQLLLRKPPKSLCKPRLILRKEKVHPGTSLSSPAQQAGNEYMEQGEENNESVFIVLNINYRFILYFVMLSKFQKGRASEGGRWCGWLVKRRTWGRKGEK